MDFIDLFLENIGQPIYGLTLLIAIWRYSKYYNTHLRYFPILVLYTLLNEVLGLIVKSNPEQFSLTTNKLYLDYNIIIYNIYNIVYFFFFLWLFRKSVTNKLHQKWILYYGIYMFLLLSIINPFFQDIFESSQLLTYSYGSIAIIITVFLYLNEINWNENKDVPQKNIMFWIGWGLVIFHTGYSLIKIYSHFKVPSNPETYIWIRRFHISLVVAMYSCFIIGFVKMKKSLIRKN